MHYGRRESGARRSSARPFSQPPPVRPRLQPSSGASRRQLYASEHREDRRLRSVSVASSSDAITSVSASSFFEEAEVLALHGDTSVDVGLTGRDCVTVRAASRRPPPCRALGAERSDHSSSDSATASALGESATARASTPDAERASLTRQTHIPARRGARPRLRRLLRRLAQLRRQSPPAPGGRRRAVVVAGAVAVGHAAVARAGRRGRLRSGFVVGGVAEEDIVDV